MSEYLSRHQSPAHEAELFLQSFEECFTERARTLGQELCQEESVENVALTHGELTARVKGGKGYPVVLDLTRERPDEALRQCTCPAFRSFGPCKHQYALLLEAAEQHSTGKLDLFDLECGGSAARREQAEREGRRWLPEWRKRLDRLGERRAVLRHDPWAAATQDRRQLRYVLMRDASIERGEMVCELSYRAKRAAGDWSNWRTASQEDRDLVHLVSQGDAELFSLLRAAMNDWFDPMEDMQAAFDSRFYCSGPLVPEIVQRLCATGRFMAGEKAAEGITWLEEPFTLRIEVGREEGQSRCEASIVSATRTIPFPELRLLLRDGVFLCDEGFGSVDLKDAYPLAAEIWREGAIEVPEEQEEQLLEQVFQWPVETKLPESVDALVQVEVGPCLYLDRPPEEVRNSSRAARTKLEARVLFDYGGVMVDPADGSPTVQIAEANEDRPAKRARRDHGKETSYLRRFLELDVRRSPMLDGRVIGTPHATIEDRQRSEIASDLLKEGWRVETDGKAWRRSGEVSFQLSTGVDWFDLSGGVDFGTERIELPRLLKALEKGERSFELEDGSIGLLDERTLRDWALLETGTATKEGTLRFGRSQGWLLDALLAERDEVRVDAGFEEFRGRLADFEGLKPRTEPESFQGTLRDYQRVGFGWIDALRGLDLGGCLADDMGLGKTVQVLAMLEVRRLEAMERQEGGETEEECKHRPSLVVAPKSLVFNWRKEAERFAPNLRVLEYTGLGRRQFRDEFENYDMLITTYGTLRRDAVVLKDAFFDYVILDEAQAIKNPKSQAAKAAKLLLGRHRLALTGTPIENHLGDLWSLFDFLVPGMLGKLRGYEKLVKATRTSGDESGENEALMRLSRALRPFFLRRTKDEVLDDLPSKSEQTIRCELSKEERAEYATLRDHFRTELLGRAEDEGLGNLKIHVLEALLRLRQTACHPGLMDKTRTEESSSKVDALIEMLDERLDSGSKVLIFSQFTSLLAIVRAKLDEREVNYAYLDGSTRKREEVVDRFQTDEECRVFLISLKAGGHGLNLTAADYVFILDPWWNPAAEAQAIDRAHRIGQTKPVFAYRFIAKDTVEEKIAELQESKRRLADALLGDGRWNLRDLSREDLEHLLT